MFGGRLSIVQDEGQNCPIVKFIEEEGRIKYRTSFGIASVNTILSGDETERTISAHFVMRG